MIQEIYNRLMVDSTKKGECLLWHGAITSRGYGHVVYNGKLQRVHRLAFYCYYEKEPALNVLHKCDNRRCWAKQHLFEGTQQENVDDMISKGRANHSHKGSANGRALLNENSVLEIKRLLKESSLRQIDIARQFNVSRAQIACIACGYSWPHVILEE